MESTESTVLVEYLGNKDRKEDNVSGSLAVWHGAGDIQPVTHAQWGALSKHPEVWRRVAKQADGVGTAKSQQPELKADASQAAQAAMALILDCGQDPSDAGLTIEQVHAFKFDFPEVGESAKPAAKSAKKGAK